MYLGTDLMDSVRMSAIYLATAIGSMTGAWVLALASVTHTHHHAYATYSTHLHVI